MNEMEMLQKSMALVLKELECQKYSKDSIKAHGTIYHSIQKFMVANKITSFNDWTFDNVKSFACKTKQERTLTNL